MSLPQHLIQEQWKTYLPFLYKFYLEHNNLNFLEVITAKWYKQPSQIKPNSMSFIIAGLEEVQHNNQGYSYKVTERLIKAYDLAVPEGFKDDETQNSKGDTLRLGQKIPEIKERNKIFYEKDITCLQDIIITQKRSIQYETSVTFYAVALKNESIHIINASKLTCRPTSKRLSFLSQRSPFMAKNINLSQYSATNHCQAALIPLQKQVTVIKFNRHDMLLLCGCTDGTIVMVNLNYLLLGNGDHIGNAYTFFTYHKRPVKDLSWMVYSHDQKQAFVSIADDGFFVWNKENITLPHLQVDEPSRLPTSLIQVDHDQFLTSGRDCSLKFFDLKKGSSYAYNQNTQIVTKLINLTGEIQYHTKSKKENLDNSLRFISCEQNGKVVFWQGQREFQHMAHQGKIASVDFVSWNGGMCLVVEKENNGKMSVFSPILLTHCLEESE